MTANRTLIQRIRRASFAELLYRGRRLVENQWLKYRIQRGAGRLSVAAPVSYRLSSPLRVPEMVCAVDEASIERLLSGATYCLYADQREVELFIEHYRHRWNGDIPHDLAEPDIRAVWEPARLQHVSTLLLVADGHPRGYFLKEYARQAVLRWIGANPFLLGPSCSSAMECGLRLPVFAYALATCEALSDDETQILLDAIYGHGWWIAHRLALFSSLGNHTVCEAVGLVVGGIVFRQLPEGKYWLDRGIALLNQEIGHQILADGGPAEQSLAYHRFVLDLYWLALGFLSCNTDIPCDHWLERLRRGEAFWQACVVDGTTGCAFGDSDDGYAVAPGIHPRREVPRSEQTVLPGTPEPWRQTQTLAASGLTLLRGQEGLFLSFDHGPLGMPPLYNHGHADALALTLSVKGKQMLVDCGTYRYNGAPGWRRYFKGTRAHNTVTIDGLDQAVQVTGFIWDKPYSAQLVSCRRTARGMYLEARHNGYTRLPQPVEHRRRLLWMDEGLLLVKDLFSGSGVHAFELNFHLHPESTITEQEGWWHVHRDEAWFAIGLLGDENLHYVFGQESPLLGWYSPAYGIRQKSGVLQCTKNGAPDAVSFTTALFFQGEPNRERLHQYASVL